MHIHKLIFFYKDNNIKKLSLNNYNLIFQKSNNFNKIIRNPGIDLVRIIGMFSIIISHILGHGKVIDKYIIYKKQLKLLSIFCNWHIKSFALISGIVGYKSCKLSNLIYLYFCVIFYSSSISFIIKYYISFILIKKKIFYFFPVIFQNYWYFSKYFGMFLFLPIINKGISIINQSELKIIIINIIVIFIIWEDLINPSTDVFNLNNGHSPLALLIIYIIGAYIGKYKLYSYNHILFSVLYFCMFILSTLTCYYLFNLPKNSMKIYFILKNTLSFRAISIVPIIQSLSLVFFLSSIKYNKLLSKIITFLGPLTFGIYLIHEHNLIRKYIISNLFTKYSKYITMQKLLYLIIKKAIAIFCITIIIDYFRNLLFKFLKIRNLSIYIDKLEKNIL